MKEQFQVDFSGSTYPAFYLTKRDEAERAILKMLESKEVFAADCETAVLPQYRHIVGSALSPHLARPRLFQFFTGKAAVVLDLMKIGELPLLCTLFQNRKSVFHNMNFDLRMLMKWYEVKYPDMECTMIQARCVLQALYPGFKSAKLGDVAEWLFGEKVIKKAGASDWGIPELSYEQIQYAAKDTVILMRIYEKLTDYITKLNLTECYTLYRKTQLLLSQMELNGISFDQELHRNHIVKWRQEMADARDEVERLTDIQGITDTKIGNWLKSKLPEDVLAAWPRTDTTDNEEDYKAGTDRLCVSADALVNYSHLEIVKPFSEFQVKKRLCTGFGMNLIDMINPATGKIHAGYTMCGARTGRVSCSNPNFLNQPNAHKDADMRKVYIASPGYEMMVSDFSQIEVRIIAEYAKEEKMLQAFEAGRDIYKHTASLLLKKPYEKVTKDERKHMKPLVLGLAYGLGASKYGHYAKKNYDLTLSLQQSKDIVWEYRNLYDKLYKWQLEQPVKCEANRYTCFAAFGKSNKLPEDRFWGASMNHPIQSAASAIMYLALLLSDKELKPSGIDYRWLGTVYDEKILEYKPEHRSFVKKVLTKNSILAYTTVMKSERTIVNLVDPLWGSNWADAKDEDKVRETA